VEELYKKYYFSIKKYISKKLDDEGLVEELTNDVLLAAFNSYPSFNKKSSEFSWICSIANHKVIDYYRKKKIKTVLFSSNPIFEEVADKALNPERDALKNELKKEIKKTFSELSEGYRKILRLKYVDGLKIAEIAKILEVSVKAVESRLIRAKQKFKKEWNYDQKEGKKNF